MTNVTKIPSYKNCNVSINNIIMIIKNNNLLIVCFGIVFQNNFDIQNKKTPETYLTIKNYI